MIEVSKSNVDIHGTNISICEKLFDIRDLYEMSKVHREIKRCRLLWDTIAYILLFLWGVVGGSAMLYIGASTNDGVRLSWGIILLILGVPYTILHGRFIRRAYFILYSDGIATVITKRKERKKLFGKQYWFTYLPFSCITDYEIKKINKDFKSILFHTKDGKVWPDAEIGITFDKSKSRKEFAEAVLRQYEKWKAEHGGRMD